MTLGTNTAAAMELDSDMRGDLYGLHKCGNEECRSLRRKQPVVFFIWQSDVIRRHSRECGSPATYPRPALGPSLRRDDSINIISREINRLKTYKSLLLNRSTNAD
jgi:hypothetical protein